MYSRSIWTFLCWYIHKNLESWGGGVQKYPINFLLTNDKKGEQGGSNLRNPFRSALAFTLHRALCCFSGIQEGVRIALDCCQASFMSYDKIVLSLKGGELWVSKKFFKVEKSSYKGDNFEDLKE